MSDGTADSQRSPESAEAPRLVVLQDGLPYHRVTRPAHERPVSPGSPWAMPPWPTLEVVKWLADRLDRYAPGRGNRAGLRRYAGDPQAQLQMVINECVIPALRAVHDQLDAEGYPVELALGAAGATLSTRSYNGREIVYAVTGQLYREPVFTLAQAGFDDTAQARQMARVQVHSRGYTRTLPLVQCSFPAMRRDAMHELRNQMLY